MTWRASEQDTQGLAKSRECTRSGETHLRGGRWMCSATIHLPIEGEMQWTSGRSALDACLPGGNGVEEMADKKRKKKMPRKRQPDTRAEPARLELGALLDRVVAILDGARERVVRQVNHEMLIAWWHIGREIVEQVQEGEGRAAYGREMLRELSKRLTERYGRGFSFTNLSYFRLFYKTYATRRPEIEVVPDGGWVGGDPTRIHHTPCDELGTGGAELSHETEDAESAQAESCSVRHKLCDDHAIEGQDRIHHKPCDELRADETGQRPSATRQRRDRELSEAVQGEPFAGFAPRLSWSHYRTLTKVNSRAERQFYEIEANAQGWSARQLERQIDTLLFARLQKSRDKAGLLELSTKGQVIESPVDVLKDPYVLDFLDLPDSDALHESDLESAILHKLRAFLLELGKGFAFVARQQRLSFEDEHFYVDLVFYNITLKCYLLIDLKVGKLTHQDIGQMDSYVRLFDDQCTAPDDNPTIGLILCAQRNEAIARYSVLSESEQIFAARYMQVLPSVEELQRELERERRRLDQGRRR